MNPIYEIACAKINLALHVRARREDGYHDIESLFAFVDAGDKIRVEGSDSLSLTVTGPFAGPLLKEPDNLVIRAARAMQAYFGVTAGAALYLDKRLPIAAGLGGGSADAAAAARALARFWQLEAEEKDLIAAIGGLGADVPVCVASRMVVGRGIGDHMEDWPYAAQWEGQAVLLVNPGDACPTGPVYRAWNGVDQGALVDDAAGWRNDLESGALRLVPSIAEVLAALRDCDGASLVRMSGSGATCFALFKDAAARDTARKVVEERHPEWWTMAGALR